MLSIMADIPLTRPTAPLSPIAASDQRAGDPRFARRVAKRRAELIAEDLDVAAVPDSPLVVVRDPTTALLEGLDRLRVTNHLRPADSEYLKALRAMQAYRDAP